MAHGCWSTVQSQTSANSVTPNQTLVLRPRELRVGISSAPETLLPSFLGIWLQFHQQNCDLGSYREISSAFLKILKPFFTLPYINAGDEANGEQENGKTERDKDVGVAVMIARPGKILLVEFDLKGYTQMFKNDEEYFSYMDMLTPRQFKRQPNECELYAPVVSFEPVREIDVELVAVCLKGFKPRIQGEIGDKGK
nr:hypothetical protein Iba_chr06cCG16570 [Ipomoea batatas]